MNARVLPALFWRLAFAVLAAAFLILRPGPAAAQMMYGGGSPGNSTSTHEVDVNGYTEGQAGHALSYFLFCLLTYIGGDECADPLSYGQASGLGASSRSTSWFQPAAIRLTNELMVGVIGGRGHNAFDWDSHDIHFKTTTNTGGAFAAYLPTPGLLVTLLGGYTDAATDMTNSGATASFHSNNLFLQGELTRRIFTGQNWSVDAEAGVSYGSNLAGGFTDSFNQFTPSSTTTTTRIRGGAKITTILPAFTWCMHEKCDPGMVYGDFQVYHDHLSGTFDDPTLETPETDYFGVIGSAGLEVPLNHYISVGGRGSLFSGGSIHGYMIMGILNVKLGEFIRGTDKPLFER